MNEIVNTLAIDGPLNVVGNTMFYADTDYFTDDEGAPDSGEVTVTREAP